MLGDAGSQVKPLILRFAKLLAGLRNEFVLATARCGG